MPTFKQILHVGMLFTLIPANAMQTDVLPPNTIRLSETMRELSAQPGFTEALLKDLQSGKGKHGAALLTPELIDHLRARILGRDWQALDHFPGWTMAEINPTVRVVGHIAGKQEAVDHSATAGGRPAQAAGGPADFLDLGDYGLHRGGSVDLTKPATGKGFDAKEFVSDVGHGVLRGDGPSALAPQHAESQRLADILNRLAANGSDNVPGLTASWHGGRSASAPQDLIAAIIATGHTVTVTDSRYFANFGHLHYKGPHGEQDVMMPFFVNTQIIIPGTKRPLLVPVAHAEYEWHIRGQQLNADVSFYFGIDGHAEFRTMDQLDQAWVMKRDAHTYTGADAVEVTRLAGAMVRAYLRLHAAHPRIPFGGYYGFGVCQDVNAAIELKMTGKATLFPNTADERFFTDSRDAEVNDLIRRLPKDRAGRPPDVDRIFDSLPVGSSDAELATITIPGLAADLIAVHHGWTAGKLRRTQSGWRRFTTPAGAAFGVLLLLALALWWKDKHRPNP